MFASVTNWRSQVLSLRLVCCVMFCFLMSIFIIEDKNSTIKYFSSSWKTNIAATAPFQEKAIITVFKIFILPMCSPCQAESWDRHEQYERFRKDINTQVNASRGWLPIRTIRTSGMAVGASLRNTGTHEPSTRERYPSTASIFTPKSRWRLVAGCRVSSFYLWCLYTLFPLPRYPGTSPAFLSGRSLVRISSKMPFVKLG